MELTEAKERNKSRAIVIRCSDKAYLELLDLIRSRSDCYLVFSKSSDQKLVIKEEGW